MSEFDHDKIESLVGAAAELARQGGYINSQTSAAAYQALTSTDLGHAGAQAVQSLAQYAPAAVATVGVRGLRHHAECPQVADAVIEARIQTAFYPGV